MASSGVEASLTTVDRYDLTRNGAAIHPTFLRVGPWALSIVVAALFGLSFATSYAALHDYARQLQFSREFAIAFPLVLDAVIVVLAVTLLLERALGRRTITLRGRQIGLRLPTWPMLGLWLYVAGSVAGNVGHTPPVLAAQLVAAVPPVSAALTFHLLLRLLDRAALLRSIAEAYEERAVEEKERAALRQARRAAIKASATTQADMGSAEQHMDRRAELAQVGGDRNGHVPLSLDGANNQKKKTSNGSQAGAREQMGDLRHRVHEALAAGERVTGETIARWLGVSPRTGRRRLSLLIEEDPVLSDALSRD
jgi:murein DD-endopeptidase MepM/ murein hydrolase activator NlpD